MEMFVSIRYLRTFLAIAESGSFAAASRSVRRTQSAVTVQMKALEDECGLVLFDRARRPPVLSPGGRAFLPRAIEAVWTDVPVFAVRANAFVHGHLRLWGLRNVITGGMSNGLVSFSVAAPAPAVATS